MQQQAAETTNGATGATGTATARSQVNGGRFDFDDGGTYCGGWEEGKAHGHGVCTGPKAQGAYSGSWHYGFEVSGVYTWPSGSCFEGQWQNGKRHGLGVETRGRWIYRGEWTQGFKGRYGVRQSNTSTAKYEGTWANGLQDGYGSETYADDGTYQGQWMRGMRHGYGVRNSAPFGKASKYRANKTLRASLTSLRSNEGPGGAPLEATDKRDRRVDDSRGGFVLKSNSTEPTTGRRRSLGSGNSKKPFFMKGIIKKPSSTGDIVSSGSVRSTGSSASYVSTDSAGSAMTNASMPSDSNASFVVEDEHMDPSVTETYMGEWKNDKRSGYGISERSDGLKYEGEWYANKKYGYGVTTFSNGEKEEGKYKNNVLITSQKKKLFLMRSAKFRERIDAAVNAAQRASKIALQKADIAISRTATARGKAEQADIAAAHAQEDSTIAEQVARQYAPDFKQPVLIKHKPIKYPPLNTSIDKNNPPNNPNNPINNPSSQPMINTNQISNQIPMTNQNMKPMMNQIPTTNQWSSSSPQQQKQVPNQAMSNNPNSQWGNPTATVNQTQNQWQNSNTISSNQWPNKAPQQNSNPVGGFANKPLLQNTLQSNPNNPYNVNSSNFNSTMPNEFGPQQQHIFQNSIDVNPKNNPMIPNDYSANSNPTSLGATKGRNSISQDEGPLPNNNSLKRMSRRVSGDRPPHIGNIGQQSSIDHFDHYKRPPSRDSSVDRYSRATRMSGSVGSRQPSVDRTSASRVETPDRTLRAPSAVRGTTPAPPTPNPGPTVKNGSVLTGHGTPSNSTPTGSNSTSPPFENVIFRKMGLGQDIVPSQNPPKRTESLFVPGQPANQAAKNLVTNTSLQRKKSLPDVQELPKATPQMSREEYSALSSERRQAIRREIDENERLRANPLLYLVSPQVKDWFSRQQLVIVVLFVNISLAIMFFKLLT